MFIRTTLPHLTHLMEYPCWPKHVFPYLWPFHKHASPFRNLIPILFPFLHMNSFSSPDDARSITFAATLIHGPENHCSAQSIAKLTFPGDGHFPVHSCQVFNLLFKSFNLLPVCLKKLLSFFRFLNPFKTFFNAILCMPDQMFSIIKALYHVTFKWMISRKQ